MDTATIQYRLSLPHALHSVSPALSALHTSRATALHPEISAVLHPTHCPKCGTYHFSGDHSSYLVGLSAKKRRKRAISPHAKVLRRRCHFCGFLIDIIDHSPAQLSGDSSRTGTVPSTPKTGQGPPSSDIHRPTGTVQPAPTPPLPRQPHPKPSHSSLRDMLSRDRQREDVAKSHKKRKEGHEGLLFRLHAIKFEPPCDGEVQDLPKSVENRMAYLGQLFRFTRGTLPVQTESIFGIRWR